MNNQEKSKEELINELEELKQKFNSLEIMYDNEIIKLKNQRHDLPFTQNQIENLLNNSNVMLYSCKASGNFDAIYITENITTVTGYTDKEFYSEGFWANNIHPDDTQIIFKNTTKLFENNSHKHEYRFRFKDGSYNWMLDELVLLRDENGNPIEIHGTWTNINSRKQIEEKLRDSFSLTEATLESIHNGILVVNKEGVVIKYNSKFVELWSIPDYILNTSDDQKLMNYVLEQLVDPDEFIAKVNELYKNPESESHDLIYFKDDRIFERISKPMCLEGEPKCRVWSFLDFTQRKRIELELKENEEKYRNLIQFMEEGLLLADQNGIITLANNAIAKMFDYNSPDEMLGMPTLNLFNNHEERADLMNELKANKKVNNYEILGKTKKGIEIWILGNYKAIYNQKGERIGTEGLFRDITERKKAEELLSQTRKNYETFFNTINDFLFILDEQGNVIHTNKTVIDRLGYTIEELLGNSVLMVHPAERREEAGRIVGEMLSGKTEFCPVPVITKSGVQIPVETRVSLGIWNNKPAIFGISKDISQLRLSEEKFAKVFYVNPSACGLSDIVTGKYIEVNNAFYKLFGYNKDEVLGKTPMELGILKDDIRTDVLKKTDEEGRVPYAEVILKSKNGDNIYAILSAENIHIQDKEYRYTVVHDITERKIAEEKLIEAKEKAEKNEIRLIDAQTVSKVGSWETDLETMEVIWSEETYKIFELNKELFQNSHPSFLNYVHPDDISRIEEVFANSFSSTDYNSVQHRIITPSGNLKYVEERWRVNHDENKKPIKAFGTCQDITEKMQFEIELIKAKEIAEESDRLKSAFLANMSHEIRTPMNGILGFANLLKTPDISGEEQLKYVQIIEKSGARMLNIINDIIDISKIEAGLMKVDLMESNLNDQIEYVYTFFKPEIEAKGMQIFLKNTLTGKEATITTDREKVFAILINLVKNAIKYSKDGSIEIGYLPASSLTGDAVLEVYVKDTGIGIAKDRQEAIFERFVQADIENRMAYQGAGLGLSISKSYVEMLGGKIWVESEEGKGSAFYFTLPYNVKPKEEINIQNVFKSDIPDNPSKNLKILIAEDDEVSEILLSIEIKTFSKEILKARTGTEAVEICRKNPDIDLILMDIQLPGLNGYEATRQIRQFNKDLIIIAQTAFGLKGDKEKALEAGCNDYISKPINKIELLGLIQKYFGK